MTHVRSNGWKALSILFFTFYLLMVGIKSGWASDFVWSSLLVGDKDVFPGTEEQLILILKAENKSSSDIYTVDKITLTFCGNPDTALCIKANTVKIWVDNDSVFDPSESVLKDTQTFNSGSPATVCFSPGYPISTGGEGYFFVTYDLKTLVTDLQTVDVQISGTVHIKAGASLSDDPVIVFSGGRALNSVGIDTVTVTKTHYEINTIGTQMAGGPFEVRIQMLDNYGNLDLDYSGGMVFVTGADGVFAPGNAPDGTVPFYPTAEYWQGISDGGEKIFAVILCCAEEDRKLKISNEGEEKETNSFTIQPGVKFKFSLPQDMPVETSADIRVEVYEPYRNVFTYSGTTQFTSTDSQAILAENYTFSEGELNKFFPEAITFKTPGYQTIMMADTVNCIICGGQGVIVQGEENSYRSINYPNPFDPHQGTTTIQFYMGKTGKAQIKIYTLTGNLVNEWKVEAGGGINSAFQWDGRDKDGNVVANGTYFCLVKTDIKKETIKISIVK